MWMKSEPWYRQEGVWQDLSSQGTDCPPTWWGHPDTRACGEVEDRARRRSWPSPAACRAHAACWSLWMCRSSWLLPCWACIRRRFQWGGLRCGLGPQGRWMQSEWHCGDIGTEETGGEGPQARALQNQGVERVVSFSRRHCLHPLGVWVARRRLVTATGYHAARTEYSGWAQAQPGQEAPAPTDSLGRQRGGGRAWFP